MGIRRVKEKGRVRSKAEMKKLREEWKRKKQIRNMRRLSRELDVQFFKHLEKE